MHQVAGLDLVLPLAVAVAATVPAVMVRTAATLKMKWEEVQI